MAIFILFPFQLDSLEYIHSFGYIHKDIKGSNLLLSRTLGSNRIFLVDFGLCSKYIQSGLHKPYQPDRR
jgi:serine/threonine protein kinase